MRTGAAACLLLLVVAQQPLRCSPSFEAQCKFDYTSLAVLSCEETTPQTPTRSCCDALLYAVDVWPPSSLDQGECCLCLYLAARFPTLRFDLAGAYVACRGKDAAAVQAWPTTTPTNCSEPCSLGGGVAAAAAPPPPPAPRSRGREHLGRGAVIGIVVVAACCIAAMALLGWWLYRAFCSPAAKKRRSPDPSVSRPEGTEMARLSSARYSTSRLIQE